MTKKPFVLMILDGFGYSEDKKYNAIAKAKTPNCDRIWQQYPNTLIDASGFAVGLPEGQMGNSEVGHMTIGAGRVIYQDLTKINKSIDNEDFFTNQVLLNVAATANKTKKNIHLLGLLSDGGIHSHQKHWHATLKLLKQQQVSSVFLHPILDGRDTPPQSALNFLQQLNNVTKELELGTIVDICGRFYAMDRDKRYERTKNYYELLCQGLTDNKFANIEEALDASYKRGENDEFVQASRTVLDSDLGLIADGDIVVFLNFRSDRARQICQALTAGDTIKFETKVQPKVSSLVTFTNYSSELTADIVFPKVQPKNTFGEYIAEHGLTQLRIAETEKYAHVTFFFNGGVEAKFMNEDRVLIPSPKVTTYDLQPEMSAKEVSEKIVTAIKNNSYDVIICNFANADMVGHTGNEEAAILAIEALDNCINDIIVELEQKGGSAIITADHGNIELMYNEETKQKHTAHTNSLVPLVFVSQDPKVKLAKRGTLADIAPSCLQALALNIPEEMTGKSLISFN